jgi:hypothetical protein
LSRTPRSSINISFTRLLMIQFACYSVAPKPIKPQC